MCDSVAVNRQGVRLGKGAGYSDIDTAIVATVHSLPVVPGDLPEAEHDFRVDFVVTPEEAIVCGPLRRPRGLYWDSLPQKMIDVIPALATRRHRV